MNISYLSRKVELNENFKVKVEQKLSKLKKFFGDNINVGVTISSLRGQFIVEITFRHDNMIFRAEKSGVNEFEAFEEASDAIVYQIKKNKTKLERKIHKSVPIEEFGYGSDVQEEEHKIVKYKRFNVKPMSVEEAMLQMELLGHNFFMFRNVDNNEINVVYLRKDGDYAVLESM